MNHVTMEKYAKLINFLKNKEQKNTNITFIETSSHLALLPVKANIRRAPENMASTGQAIPTSPANLLVVRLHFLRSTIVDDFADVCFVNPHAKGDCGYDTLRARVMLQ